MGEEAIITSTRTTTMSSSAGTGVDDDEEYWKKEAEGAHFVLVHGIGGGSWCWYKVRCLLETSGYKVSCVDLKGAGIHPSHADSILSFDDYNQPLLDLMSSLPDHHQVVLVGHSAGGLSVTQASLRFPNKVRLAVYVAATMLQFGFQTDLDILHGVPDLSSFGDVYDFGYGMGADKPPTSALVKKHLQRQIIYHLSPPEDSILAEMLLRPGPVQALTSAQFEKEEAQAQAPSRVYVKTSQDKVVKPEQQDAMVERWAPSQVYVIDTDHSPFFSSPSLLVDILLKAIDATTNTSLALNKF